MLKRCKYRLIITLVTSSAPLASEDIVYPKDVTEFIETRDLCDYFRGEPSYNKGRRKFLIKRMNELCTGSDKTLMNLKNKYRAHPDVIEKLKEYEENIEPNK